MQKKLRGVKEIHARHTGKPEKIAEILKQTGNIPIPDNIMCMAADVWETASANTQRGYHSPTIAVAAVVRYILSLDEFTRK